MRLLVLFVAVVISGCSSNPTLNRAAKPYSYAGEKYGKVVVVLSDQVSTDATRSKLAEDLHLETHLIERLAAEKLYDAASPNEIDVKIDGIHVRNAVNSFVGGLATGADIVDSTVTLVNERQKRELRVEIKYANCLWPCGQNSGRLDWLGGKYAEKSVNTILGRVRPKKPASNDQE